MERRVLIAVLLSFVVLYGYQAIFQAPATPGQKPAASSKVATAPNASAPAPANPTPSVPAVPAEAPPGAAAVPEQEVVVENSDVRAVFTTRGAAIKSWQLKKYRDSTGHPYEMV